MTPTLPRLARRGLLAGAVALAVGTVGPATFAGAQPTPSFTLDPATIAVGESSTITATGCVDEGVDQALLFVALTVEHDGESSTEPLATDPDGTVVFPSGEAPPEAVGTYALSASCVIIDGESTEVVFDYDGPVVLTVVAAAPTTTTTAAGPTTTAAAAEAATVSPSFTG